MSFLYTTLYIYITSFLAREWTKGPELNAEPNPLGQQSHWSYFHRHHRRQSAISV